MTFRFSPASGSEKRRTLTVLLAFAVIASVIAVVFLIRIKNWHEKREFGDLIAIVNSEYNVRRDWDDFTLLSDDAILDSRCADSFELMLSDCIAAGGRPVCRLSYISEYKHRALFEALCRMYTTQYGYSQEQAEHFSEILLGNPGHSEHQLGTAVDIFDSDALSAVLGDVPGTTEDFICSVAENYAALESAQKASATFEWLSEHCKEYGFILRYPQGSENSTGRNPNYWHFRYVGNLAAKQISELGIALEDYSAMFY